MSHQLQRITDDIFLVQGKNKGRFPFSHSTLIFGESKIILIDTGCGIENLKSLKNEFQINCIINSHTHPDYLYQ